MDALALVVKYVVPSFVEKGRKSRVGEWILSEFSSPTVDQLVANIP